MLVGIFAAVVGGVGQPVFALIAGRLTNILLVSGNETMAIAIDQLAIQGYQDVYIFLGIGVGILIISFMQVRIYG